MNYVEIEYYISGYFGSRSDIDPFGEKKALLIRMTSLATYKWNNGKVVFSVRHYEEDRKRERERERE